MTSSIHDSFMAAMPPGLDKPNPGMNLETDYQTGEARGVARTEEQVYASRMMQAYAIAEAGGAAGALDSARLDADDRQKAAVPILTRMGVEVPERITTALAVSGRVELALTPDNPYLDVRTVPLDEIRDRVREHIAQKQREAFLHTESAVLRQQASHGVVAAFRGSLSDVLAAKPVRSEFDEAARVFLDVFPTVSACRSIGDAAMLDETGEAVAAYHRAVKAVRRMDEVVSLLVWFAAPPKSHATGTHRRLMESGEILGLSATPVDTAVYLGALTARGIDHHEYLRKPTDEPFGLYGAQVEAGCTLSLPASAEELSERADAFDPYAAIAEAMLAG